MLFSASFSLTQPISKNLQCFNNQFPHLDSDNYSTIRNQTRQYPRLSVSQYTKLYSLLSCRYWALRHRPVLLPSTCAHTMSTYAGQRSLAEQKKLKKEQARLKALEAEEFKRRILPREWLNFRSDSPSKPSASEESSRIGVKVMSWNVRL